MKQVLINLLSNAIKYNTAGGSVVVDCRASAPGRIRIGVTDTGAGLSPDQLAQLFQPFNRLGQEATSEQGTGIGLVVCKRLTELMGGVIGVESHGGQGQHVLDRVDADDGAVACCRLSAARDRPRGRKSTPTRTCAPSSMSRITPRI